jgi:eukaryotic-like serine/threonine-protein kinase
LPSPDVLIAGRYRLVERIASGGMGSVWEAWDERLHRRVAVKQLHPQPGLSRAEAQLAGDRAMREARITARLHHAHAVPVYDVVDFEGQPCLIMQYLPSRSMQAMVRERGVLGVDEVARLGGEVAAALTAAHAVGIVHRDVKPGNVLIDEDGAAKLTDFGISHAAGDATLTSTGMVTGTPAFLSPEVARGAESTPASDVFSLGSTLYAALEGQPPFGSDDNPMATLHRVASGQIIPPQRSGPLTPVLLRMLDPDPSARPPMKQVAETLTSVAVTGQDPAAGAPTQQFDPTRRLGPTQRLAPPVGPAEPPGTTVTLPAAGSTGDPGRIGDRRPVGVPPPVGRPPRRRRGLPGLVAVLVLLLAGLGIVLATQLSAGSGNSPAANGSTGSTGSTHRSSAGSSAPQSQHRSTPRTSSQQPSGAAQLKAAVRDYYGLLPDDANDAWKRLTPEYQHGTEAGGKGDYEKFWKSIDSVSVSDLSATPPGSVVATVHYVMDDGSSSSERRSFELVEQEGILKIAASSIVG